jgi:ribonuclease P protein component
VLPAGNRLRRRREFATAVRRGRRAGRHLLVVHLYVADSRVEDPAGVRIGLVVGRTVGSAVLRNRVKRRLRHLLRERMNGLPAAALLVVRALPGAAAASSTRLAAELDGALERVLQRRTTAMPAEAKEGVS